MKKLSTMIAALLMTLTTSAQFEQDKMYVGGSLTGLDLNYNGSNKPNLDIQAQASYLFEDNLMVLGSLSYQHSRYEPVPNYISAGVGGCYYIVQSGIYLDINYKLIRANHNCNDVMPGIEVGYVYFLSRTVTVEPAVYYNRLFKKHGNFSTIGLKIGTGMYL